MDWPSVQLRHICRFAYGESLPNDLRSDGSVAVFGSNGPTGTHTEANTGAPVIVIGRKGSHGRLRFSEKAVFAIDTTYFVDPTHTSAYPRWLFYVLSTLGLDELTVDVGVPGLSREKAYQLRLPLPPRAAQKAIADFLDAEVWRIDGLIRLKGQMRVKLEQRLRSLISSSVTQESEKHGDSPIASACQLVTDCVNKTAPTASAQTPYRMIRTSNVRHGRVLLDDALFVDWDTYVRWSRRARPSRGDVILTREAPVGEVGMIEADDAILLGQRLMLFRADLARALPRYLTYCLRSWQAQDQLFRLGAGSLHAHVRVADCAKLRIPLPPLEQQAAVVEYLGAAEDVSNGLLGRLDTQLALLAERKQALITAAVTGQLEIPRTA